MENRKHFRVRHSTVQCCKGSARRNCHAPTAPQSVCWPAEQCSKPTRKGFYFYVLFVRRSQLSQIGGTVKVGLNYACHCSMHFRVFPDSGGRRTSTVLLWFTVFVLLQFSLSFKFKLDRRMMGRYALHRRFLFCRLCAMYFYVLSFMILM